MPFIMTKLMRITFIVTKVNRMTFIMTKLSRMDWTTDIALGEIERT